jgi:hypothetical protein
MLLHRVRQIFAQGEILYNCLPQRPQTTISPCQLLNGFDIYLALLLL